MVVRLQLLAAAALFMAVRGVRADDEDGEYDPYFYDAYADAYGGEDFTGEPYVELKSEQELSDFLEENNQDWPVAIGFFDRALAASDADVFQKVAEENQFNIKFAYVTDQDMLEARNYDRMALLCYKPRADTHAKYDKGRARYPGRALADFDAVEYWLYRNAIATVGLRSWSTAAIYEELERPLVLLYTKVDRAKNKKQYEYYANRLRKAAKQLRDKDSAIFAVAHLDDYEDELELFKWTTDDAKEAKALLGVRDGNRYFAQSRGVKFSADSVITFVNEVLDGRRAPIFIQEDALPEAEDGDAGGDGESAGADERDL